MNLLNQNWNKNKTVKMKLHNSVAALIQQLTDT